MNVLVVVCDALHVGYVGCYGNEWVQTPHLDGLANDGFVFDRCYPNAPQPGCWRETGLTGNWQPSAFKTSARPSLERLLAESGRLCYFTEQPKHSKRTFGDWLRSRRASEVSLDEVREHPEYRVPPPDAPGFDEWVPRWQRQLAMEKAHPERAPEIEVQFSRAEEWIAKNRSATPKMVWLDVPLQCMNPSDTPWLPPRAFVEQYLDEETPTPVRDPMPGFLGETLQEEDLIAAQVGYAARVSFFDELLGSLIDSLRDELDDWTIVVTSDQGFPMGEHSAVGNIRPWLYEERCHTPLLVRDPKGRISSRSPALVQSVDLFPTLCELFDFEIPDNHGRSLLPLLRGEGDVSRDYICSGVEDAEYCIRTNHWNLLLPVRWDYEEDRRRELYAKPEDRWDVNNVEELQYETANHLELQLRRYIDATERNTLSMLPPLDKMLLMSEAH